MDYAVRFKNIPDHRITGYWTAYEYQLGKKKPPQEKSTWEEIQEITNWNPSKSEVKHD